MPEGTSVSIAIINFFTHNFVWLLLVAALVWFFLYRRRRTTRRVESFKEAVKWLVEHRPDDPRVVKAAVLRSKKAGGRRFELVLAYMDANNELVCDAKGAPYGVKREVDGFDDELERAFGEHDLIIVD
ncbi:MAG: hypothetical protein LBR38_03685 [Synergistaceae bacterium]|jgi:hypothetical protein|nr:hypothetical protein [Synergistaceae bacterium]